jgi:hypothetical protein
MLLIVCLADSRERNRLGLKRDNLLHKMYGGIGFNLLPPPNKRFLRTCRRLHVLLWGMPPMVAGEVAADAPPLA